MRTLKKAQADSKMGAGGESPDFNISTLLYTCIHTPTHTYTYTDAMPPHKAPAGPDTRLVGVEQIGKGTSEGTDVRFSEGSGKIEPNTVLSLIHMSTAGEYFFIQPDYCRPMF